MNNVTTTEKLSELLAKQNVSDKNKLQKQQEYYQRLIKSGTAKKQTYNLKSVSAI